MPKKRKAPPASGNVNDAEQEEEKEEDEEEQEPSRVPSAVVVPQCPSVINAQMLILEGIVEMRASFGIESKSDEE